MSERGIRGTTINGIIADETIEVSGTPDRTKQENEWDGHGVSSARTALTHMERTF